MRTNNDLLGIFPDVAYRDGLLFIARGGNGFLSIDRLIIAEDRIESVYRVPCIGSAFVRIRNIDDKIYFIYREGDGLVTRFINLDTLEARSYSGVFYNWPLALGKSAYAMNNGGDGVHGDGLVHIYSYDGTELTPVPAVPVTGIARIEDNNIIVSNDENRSSQLVAWQLFSPEYASELFCGASTTGGVAVVANNQKKKILNEGTNTFDPKITKCGLDKWAIVTGDYTRINIFYDISLEDIIGNSTYNPKPELISIRAQLDQVISKL